MNIENKKEIIKNLFEHQFNKDNFRRFVNDILNVKVLNRNESEKIYKVFKDYIESYHIISDYKDNEKNDILIITIKIKDDKDPIKARVKQREFVAKLLRERIKDAALVTFYNENNKNWRISFIRLNYEFTSKGIEEKITPAKRLSYVVGEGEASKTVREQFFTLANMEESVSLEQLEGLFALEKVTNEFFKEYKNKYLDIKETLIKDENFVSEALKHDIENPESFIEGFSKKLMGQIAFIYFLQKKGWLGIEIVPKSLTFEEYNKIYERALDNEKEILNKVFFRKEKDLYILNKEELKKLDNKNESELLVGAFHNTEYFKDWGSGKKKFLRELFEKHKKEDKNNEKTFFEDYLEPLFYNNFSEDRGEKQYSAEFNCRLPFLNGGLFDPYGDYNWKDTIFNLDDSLFSNDKNDGILDIFDRYNFTINENDNYETEVAVDPEMLGKVFENLLEVSDRKSKGAFYTPREIVRYMTNESIMNYLLSYLEEKEINKEDLEYLFNLGEFTKEYDEQIFEKDYITDSKKLEKGILGMPINIITYSKEIDELLEKVKIADPACGSGAFPLGILNEIVRARNILTFYINMIEILKEKDERNYWSRLDKKQKSRTPYELKLYAIQNSLYGVDIEPSAIDITKLRLWLSILVDSTNNDVRPLPNLDFNFMIGNSLIDEFEGMKLFDESLLDDKILEKKMKKVQMKLFMSLEEKQQDILKEIFIKQSLFFYENDSDKKKELKNDIEELENNLIELTLNENGNHKKLEEIKKGRKERRKPYFLWKLEFAKVFKENGGFDIVIGNPPYIDSEEMTKKMSEERETYKKIYSCAKGNWDIFIIFIELGYTLLKRNGIISYIVPNKLIGAKYSKNIKEYMMKYKVLTLRDYSEVEVFETAAVYPIVFISQKYELKKQNVITEIMKDIIKIKSHFEIKKEDFYKDIFWDKFFSKDAKEISLILKLLNNKKLIEYVSIKGAATVGEAYKVKEVLIDNTDLNIKKDEIKFINTGTIDKYKILWGSYDTQYIKSKYKYPIIFEKELKNISNERFKETRSEKLIVAGMTKEIEAVYDKGEYLAGKSTQLILEKDKNISLKYILSLINSKLLVFFFKKMFNSLSMSGGFFTIGKEQLSNLPIIIDKNQKRYIELVDEIIELKKLNKDTQFLEDRIDEMVYELYGLTEEEKGLVRNFNSK